MGRADLIAVLTMYDWPQVRADTDQLWAAVRDNLTDLGVEAPRDLSRPDDVMAAWKSPLAMAKSCVPVCLTRCISGARTRAICPI